jgi:hypothetical protein
MTPSGTEPRNDHDPRQTKPSPRILEIEWGSVVVEGFGAFKDAKLFPGGATSWDWSLTDTHHVPGIQPADAEDLVRSGAQKIVLSQGMLLALQVQKTTVEWLAGRDIAVMIAETRQAVALYNRLVEEGLRVGALIHSTC